MNDFKKDASNSRKLMKKSTPIILVGVAIMIGLSIYVVGNNPTLKETLEAERPVERKTMLQLSVFEYKDKNRAPISAVKNGTTLAFDLASNVPVHVALLVSVNNKTPEILFEDAKIPPGEHKKLEKAGNRFIYKVITSEGNIKFCLVQGNSTSELMSKLLRPKNTWLRIPQAQCVQLRVE